MLKSICGPLIAMLLYAYPNTRPTARTPWYDDKIKCMPKLIVVAIMALLFTENLTGSIELSGMMLQFINT